MKKHQKLFLYSLSASDDQFKLLDELVGRKRSEITFGIIANATDVIENSEGWVGEMIGAIGRKGYKTETIDLRNWTGDKNGLKELIASKDVIWVCGGHTYYLRWILAESGADEIIIDLVNNGKVYAGWSAGAVVAGPTTKYFNHMGDNPEDSPQVILNGLNLTNCVVVPHIDHPDFEKGAALTNHELIIDGYETITLKDNQVLIIDGDNRTII